MAREEHRAILDALRTSRVSVVVPVFNEAPRIRANLELLVAEVAPNFQSYEVLVVSDGSTDGTEKEVRALAAQQPNLRLLVLDRNMGKGHAVRRGFQEARGDYVFFIDGGMELHPRELRIFMGLMALYDVDMVVGSKRHPQSKVRYPWYRRGLSMGLQQVVRAAFDVNVTDTQVGMKLFKREVLDAVLPDLRIDRYGFDLELLVLARQRGYGRVLEAPITLDYFLHGPRGGVADLWHVLKVGTALLGDTWRLYRRVRHP